MRSIRIAAFGVLLVFVTSPAAGAYTVGEPSKGTVEATQQEAERAAREQKEANERAAKATEEKNAAEEHQHQEAERTQAQQAKEAAEQKAKEAAEQKAKEETSRCVVPTLRGDSINSATATLRKAHCSLGKVSGPHRDRRALIVVSQRLRPGTKLPAGTAVGVTLGRAKHTHH
jgi:hypothetical protein